MTTDPTHEPTPNYATAADLAPEIRAAIATVIGEIWDREENDYYYQPEGIRAGHPFESLIVAHKWLGPYSPIRTGPAQHR